MTPRQGRGPAELRPVTIVPRFLPRHPANCLIRCGDTWVLCAASVASSVPPFLEGKGQGWCTAEYSMLPGASAVRVPRERQAGGRSQEISRLIGRSLRAALDLAALGTRTITVDCDVLQADGGTRTAAITGGYVALALALRQLAAEGVPDAALRHAVAAVSVGIVDDELRLDLDYAEDSSAAMDVNVVMTSAGEIVEVQGTAEGRPIGRADLDRLLDLAAAGIRDLLTLQAQALASIER